MRRLLASAFTSLDGVMQAPGGPEEDPGGGFAFGGWTVPYWEGDRAMGDALDRLFKSDFALLLGRRTYDIFAAYWPNHDDHEIGVMFNAAAKYVVTSSTEPLTWAGSVAVRGDIPSEVAKLKQQEGPDLLIQGSAMLLRTMLAEGLLDELTLFTFPVMLGRGKRWFDDHAQPMTLHRVDSALSENGVSVARYRPAGEVRTGTFVPEEPTEAEIERRKALAQES